MPTLPAPPQLLLSHLELKLSVPSVGVVTPCAAEPRFYHCPDAAGPTGVRALCGREGGRQAGRHCRGADAAGVYATTLPVGAAARRKTGWLRMMYRPHVQGSCAFVCLL